MARMEEAVEGYKEGFGHKEDAFEALQAENDELRCKLAGRSGRKHTRKKVGRPAKVLEETSAEGGLKEDKEKNFENAEKAIRKRHMDLMEHNLKILRERQYFATDEIAQAAQAERANGGTWGKSDMEM